MKSIATELVNEYKRLKLIIVSRYDYSGFRVNAIDMSNIKVKAKQHALTINLILDCDEEMIDERLRYFLNEELNILKRGNLI